MSPSAIPAAGPVAAPGTRVIFRAQAITLGAMVDRVLQENVSCFEGEDLSLARALADKLKTLSDSSETSAGLDEEEARVLGVAEACAKAFQAGIPGTGTPTAATALTFIPVAIAVGVGTYLLYNLLSVD